MHASEREPSVILQPVVDALDNRTIERHVLTKHPDRIHEIEVQTSGDSQSENRPE